ncbi:hypothetical protein QUF72_05400 [Desulfobacterales bacterium HSG2]|nr:hypothetical protein [Desulfobacterales bacterium HSG2]
MREFTSIPSEIGISKAVIPGRMSEAGSSQTLITRKRVFRHSDPESMREFTSIPSELGISKAVIPGRMSEAGSSQTLVNPERGFRHSDPESTHGIYGNPRRA